MTNRRPSGALEADVLRHLRAQPAGLTPRELRDRLADERFDLAYTTVATSLTRLWEKGEVTRQPSGRTFRYVALRDEAKSVAVEMRSLLAGTRNRRATLASFVSALSTKEERTLRLLLRDVDS